MSQVRIGSAFNVQSLDSLSDVTITSATDGELLTYDSTTGEWINKAPPEKAAIKWAVLLG